jgi:hypothetical protein
LIIVNWAHVRDVSNNFPDEMGLDTRIRWGDGTLTFANAKDITVVGEGSMRVNQWLAEVAEKAEETE